MVKLILMVAILSGASTTACLAAGACQKAEGLRTAEKADNRTLAKAIKCLASDLAKKQLSKDESIHSVETIEIIASKIITNGNTAGPPPPPQQNLSPPTLASVAPSASEPSPNTVRSSAQYAQAIVCEGDKILETLDPQHKAAAQKGWCVTPKGSPVVIKRYASKIIGNG